MPLACCPPHGASPTGSSVPGAPAAPASVQVVQQYGPLSSKDQCYHPVLNHSKPRTLCMVPIYQWKEIPLKCTQRARTYQEASHCRYPSFVLLGEGIVILCIARDDFDVLIVRQKKSMASCLTVVAVTYMQIVRIFPGSAPLLTRGRRQYGAFGNRPSSASAMLAPHSHSPSHQCSAASAALHSTSHHCSCLPDSSRRAYAVRP